MAPLHLRVPIVCALSLLWNTYFSYITSLQLSEGPWQKTLPIDRGDQVEEDGDPSVVQADTAAPIPS